MSKVDGWTDEQVDTCLRLLGLAEEALRQLASDYGGELPFDVACLVRDMREFRREVGVRVVRSAPAEAMRIVCGIDWDRLREQKRWLREQSGEEAAGLMNLIDSLQDFAVDRLGKLQAEVFDFDYETREPA